MKPALVARALVCAFPCLAIAQVATLQIKVLEGDAEVHTAGSRSARPLAVQVTDETGDPVQGAAVSFRLPDEGPGGVFSNQLHTEVVVSDANGRATVRNLQVNRTAGTFQIRITAAKERARAGTFSKQFIEDGPAATHKKTNKRWIFAGVLAAGVGGFATARLAVGSVHPVSAPVPVPVAAGPPVSVGTPVITVGRP